MRPETTYRLRERNNRIIQAVIKKTREVCPESVAIIGVAGSFCSGEFHERSDLDLCIVTNDNSARVLTSCFILDGIGHDIYCTPWQKLEEMANYPDPHVAKLMDLDIVYQRSDADVVRYLSLREAIAARLSAPFSVEDAETMNRHLESAKREYARVMLADEAGECKYGSMRMLNFLEYVVYTANKSYIRRGVRRISEEIEAMNLLPDGFVDERWRLVYSRAVEEIQHRSTNLMKAATKFAAKLTAGVTSRKRAGAADLRGSYEEIVSNWRNKMQLAAESGDEYLALASMASCQELYDELSDEFDIDALNLFRDSALGDLQALADNFDAALERYRGNYEGSNLAVRTYDTIDEFERDYGGTE